MSSDRVLINITEDVGITIPHRTFIADNNIYLKLRELNLSIPSPNQLFYSSYANTVLLAHLIHEMKLEDTLNVTRLTLYQDMLEYNVVLFALAYSENVFELLPEIENAYYDEDLSHNSYLTYMEQCVKPNKDKSYYKFLNDVVLSVFDIFNMNIKRLNLVKTLQLTEYALTKPNYMNKVPAKRLKLNNDNLTIRNTRDNLLIRIEDETGYYVLPNLHELTMHYTNGRVKNMNYTELLERLESIDYNLANELSVPSYDTPPFYINSALLSLNITVPINFWWEE